MQESKLLKYYATLEKQELKAWEAFLNSPFFNTNNHVIKLNNLLKKYYPDLSHPALAKGKVFKKIFKAPYNDLKMRKLMSATVKLLEKYWVYTKLEKEGRQYDMNLATCYYERALYEQFEKSYRNQIATLENKSFKTEEELQLLMNAYHQLSYNLNPNKKELNLFDIEKVNKYLWEYTQQQSMFYSSDWNFRKRLFEITIPPAIIEINQKIVSKKNNQFDKTSTGYIYQQVNKMWLEGTEKATTIFFELRTFLQNNVLLIDAITSHWLFSHLLNFGIRKERMTDFSKESLVVYELGLAHNLFLYKNRITNIKFANTVFQFCLFQKFDLATLFIQKYQGYLLKKNGANYIKIAESYVLFFSKAYKDCFYLLSSFYFQEGVIPEIVRRGLQIRSAFECYLVDQTFYELLNSTLNNYDQYLKNDTLLSEEKKQPYSNFNSVLIKFTKWKEGKNRDTSELLVLKKNILAAKYFMPLARDWIIQHIDNHL